MIPTAPMDSEKSTVAKDTGSNTPNRSSRSRSGSKSPQPNQSPNKYVNKTDMIVTTTNNSSSFKCNLKCKKSSDETFV